MRVPRVAHGSGLGNGDPALDTWSTLLEHWLRGRGWLSPDPAVVEAIKAAQDAARATAQKR